MPGGSITILLIEDNPGDARLLREILSEANGAPISLMHASGLQEGMDHLAKGGIDGILLDLGLSDSYGLDTLAKVQAGSNDLPIIVLTGFDDRALAERAVREGAQDYLVKGQVDGELLYRSIRYAIERKRAEMAFRELERRAMIQEKLASLGQVAASIVHEIRNPLSGLNIYLSTLESMVGEDRGVETPNRELTVAIVGKMKSAAGKIGSVIERVTDFTKPHPLKLGPVIVNAAVEDAFALSQAFLGRKKIRLTKSLDPELPPVLADLQMIEQVILNLVTNAAQATEGTQGPHAIHIASFRHGDSVVISVSDSGPGVPVELREKIFDPFFTTRSDGTGIGLSICQRIVTGHSGTLAVGAAALGGAEFRIFLPVRPPVVTV